MDVAAATKISTDWLKKVESRTSLPWDVPSTVVAQIVCLYGVPIRDLERLTQNSCNMAIFSRRISDRNAASSSATQWISEVRAALKQLGAKELVK